MPQANRLCITVAVFRSVVTGAPNPDTGPRTGRGHFEQVGGIFAKYLPSTSWTAFTSASFSVAAATSPPSSLTAVRPDSILPGDQVAEHLRPFAAAAACLGRSQGQAIPAPGAALDCPSPGTPTRGRSRREPPRRTPASHPGSPHPAGSASVNARLEDD